MNSYDLGEEVRIKAKFSVLSATEGPPVLTDPTTQLVLVRNPLGITITATPAKISTGVWHALVQADKPGVWEFSWRVSAPFFAAEDDTFFVENSSV